MRRNRDEEYRIRRETDALILECQKYSYIGPLTIQQQQIAYEICKEDVLAKKRRGRKRVSVSDKDVQLTL